MRNFNNADHHATPECDAVDASIRSALDASPVAAIDVVCAVCTGATSESHQPSGIVQRADGVWTAQVLHANDIAWRLFDANSAESLARHLQKELARVEVQITLLACLRTGTLRHAFGIELCTMTGDSLQLNLSANRIGGTDGLPARLVVYMEDRSDLKASLRNQDAYRNQLTHLVERRNQELMLLHNLASDRTRLIENLLLTRSPHIVSHMRRVSVLAERIGRHLGLDGPERADAVCAAALHDVGVLNVPYEILGRSGPLSDAEFALVQQHPLHSCDILAAGGFPESVLRIIAEHHERCDGSGYPLGVEGDDICLGARILAVADVVDAMTAQRPHRPSLDLESALDVLKTDAHCFDPRVVDACVAVLESGVSLDDESCLEPAALHVLALDATSAGHQFNGLVS